jgi:hypothetical protein
MEAPPPPDDCVVDENYGVPAPEPVPEAVADEKVVREPPVVAVEQEVQVPLPAQPQHSTAPPAHLASATGGDVSVSGPVSGSGGEGGGGGGGAHGEPSSGRSHAGSASSNTNSTEEKLLVLMWLRKHKFDKTTKALMEETKINHTEDKLVSNCSFVLVKQVN